MLQRKPIFPHVIEINHQAGQRLGCNVYLVYDAAEWAARLPWSNGRVGTTGQSYLGLTQYLLACNDPMPPSLQVMAPVSASSDYHQSWIYHTGGASLWGWMVPYAIFKGRNTLRRRVRSF